MGIARANGMELAYEVIGEGEPVLLIMGLGAQLIHWPDAFCQRLAERGLSVIRFDNRDVGLSTKLEHAGRVRLEATLARAVLGLEVQAPYTLIDMADDAVGLLDALGIDRAHVVGASMGGMIGQVMAIRHPERTATLTSIMSHEGSRRFLLIDPRVASLLLGKAPRSREEAMDRAEVFFRMVGSRGLDADLDTVRERAGHAYDRCSYPPGFVRQLAAVLAAPRRADALRHVRVPGLVIHGSRDPLIPVAGGIATAAAIPDAELRIVEGMGHDLPEGVWPLVIDGIASLAQRGSAAATFSGGKLSKS